MLQYKPAAKHLFFVSLLAALLFSQRSFAQSSTHEDSLIGALNPMRMYDVRYYRLQVRVDVAARRILGVCTITFKVPQEMSRIQLDLLHTYNVRGVSQSGVFCLYTRTGDQIYVDLPQPAEKGQTVSLDVLYSGVPPVAQKPPWDGGFVWTTDDAGKPWVAVACEGLGASSWWPCKDHLSDEPDSMDISIEVPYGTQAISNGHFMTAKDLYNGYNRYDWRVHYPINNYDVTLNAGNYVTVHDTFHSTGGNISLDYYVHPYNKDKAEAYFSKQVKPMLRCFEHYFGPYPFTKDGYALVEDPYWGMEHQSAIAYGNNFKLNDFGFDFIIVHESAHEWWGNSLSASDEAEMWLHESFATYAEALYVEYYQGKDSALKYLESQKKEIKNKLPMIGPMNVNYHNRPDNDIYYKGTWMLHTLRHAINNDSLWFRILYTFQQQYKYKIIHTEDFVRLVDSLTGTSYDKFFDQYLHYPHIPVLLYQLKGSGKKARLSYRWDTDVKDFTMPVEIEVSGKTYRLEPTNEAQKLKLKKAGLSANSLSDIRVKTEYFYVDPIATQNKL